MRHGQPAWIVDGNPELDPILTELGREQAELVGARIAARGATEIVTSPARRARETAEPLARALGLTPHVVDDLVELRLPDWSGLTPQQYIEKFRDARKRHPNEWWDGLPGGEAFTAFSHRVRAAVDSLLEARGIRRLRAHTLSENPDCPACVARADHQPLFEVRHDARERIVVFGHGGTNTVAMTVLLGVACVPWEWERFTLSHAGILRLKAIPLGPGYIFSLRAFNDCEHIPKAKRSV